MPSTISSTDTATRYAVKFDGSNDTISCGNTTIIKAITNITVEAWIRLDQPNAYNWIVAKGTGNSPPNGWEVFTYGSGGVFGIRFDGRTATSAGFDFNDWDVGKRYVKNRWYFTTATYNGTTAIIYVDGFETNRQTKVGSLSFANTTNILRIGSRSNLQYPLNGSISNVRIYNRAITATEVLQHYQGFYFNQTGLVAEYLMNEGTGTTITDTSGYGNNGTFGTGTAAPTWKLKLPWIQGVQSITL